MTTSKRSLLRDPITPPADAAQAYKDGLDAGSAMKEFESNRCPCGNRKREETSFCFRCTQVLPAVIRGGLGMSIRGGYIEAWKAAKGFLYSIGRIKEIA